ncbi:MAG: hypothetical protein ACE1Z0_07965, partial [Acidimicrobiia bacterium]
MKATRSSGLGLFALLAVFALVVAACTSGETTDTTEGEDDRGSTTTESVGVGDDGEPDPVEGGTFRIGFISNITTDNWFASLDTLNSTNNQAYLGNAKTSMFKLTNPGFVYV